MSDPLKRRDFIKNLSLAGAGIAVVNTKAPWGSESSEIKNDYFTVSFDKKKGTINILRKNGASLMIGGTVCVNSGKNKSRVSPGNYQYTSDSKKITGLPGPGEKL